jgi:predicted RNase H-like HicB family nuclease
VNRPVGAVLPRSPHVVVSSGSAQLATSWVGVVDRVVFQTPTGPAFRQPVWGAECWKGLGDVSETYTAVYERDGEAWVVEIAEKPSVRCLCPSVAEARESIRSALARWLETDSDKLRVVDEFRLPAQIRTARQSVKETRTDDERNQMMASMTDSRSAISWAEDLGISMRDPTTVEALKNLGNREISIDTFCHTITMAEELSRLTATSDRVSLEGVLEKD